MKLIPRHRGGNTINKETTEDKGSVSGSDIDFQMTPEIRKELIDSLNADKNAKNLQKYKEKHDSNPLRKAYVNMESKIDKYPWYARIPSQIITSPATLGYELSKFANPDLMNMMPKEEVSKGLINTGFAAGDAFLIGKGLSGIASLGNLKNNTMSGGFNVGKRNAQGLYPHQAYRRALATLLGIKVSTEIVEDQVQSKINENIQ